MKRIKYFINLLTVAGAAFGLHSQCVDTRLFRQEFDRIRQERSDSATMEDAFTIVMDNRTPLSEKRIATIIAAMTGNAYDAGNAEGLNNFLYHIFNERPSALADFIQCAQVLLPSLCKDIVARQTESLMFEYSCEKEFADNHIITGADMAGFINRYPTLYQYWMDYGINLSTVGTGILANDFAEALEMAINAE